MWFSRMNFYKVQQQELLPHSTTDITQCRSWGARGSGTILPFDVMCDDRLPVEDDVITTNMEHLQFQK